MDTDKGNIKISKIEEARQLKPDKIKEPYIPVGIYLQEAEDLCHWCKNDIDKLTGSGLDKKIIEDLPVLAEACREAQCKWIEASQDKNDSEDRWAAEWPGALKLYKELLTSYKFAFRKNKDLLKAVKSMAKARALPIVIQRLNDLSVLGRNNIELLEAVGLDLNLIKRAAKTSEEMGALLGKVRSERGAGDKKRMRDALYTLLKYVVDEIRDYGKFVFRNNEDRLKGYRSEYIRKSNQRRNAESDKT